MCSNGYTCSGLTFHYHSITDDYAENGGLGEVWLLCSFYHEPLRTWIKTIVDKFTISQKYLKAQGSYNHQYITQKNYNCRSPVSYIK